MLRITTPIGFGLLFFGLPSQSATWVELFSTPEASAYADTDSLTIGGESARVWLKYVPVKPMEIPEDAKRTTDAGLYDYQVSLKYFQCKERRVGSVREDYFASDGTLLASRLEAAETAQYYDIPPDSIGERLFKKLCTIPG